MAGGGALATSAVATAAAAATSAGVARRDLIVIGGSAGAVEALRALVAELPANLPAAVVVVIHVPPSATSALPAILQRAGKLPAKHVMQEERLELGHIYVAPPDHHLLLQSSSHARVSRGPRVNNHRPAIDPLFLSAARWRQGRVISVVLSGLLDDGTGGTFAVRLAGGVTIAQSPDEALYGAMPMNAIEHAGVDHVLPIAEISKLLIQLAGVEIPSGHATEPTSTSTSSSASASDCELGETWGGPMNNNNSNNLDDVVERELDASSEEQATTEARAPSGFTCPDCHGALWELSHVQAQLLRFRCRAGHSYGAESLVASQSEKVEDAIWFGYRALEESAALAERLAENAAARGMVALAARYRLRYEDALERAATLRSILDRGQLAAGSVDG